MDGAPLSLLQAHTSHRWLNHLLVAETLGVAFLLPEPALEIEPLDDADIFFPFEKFIAPAKAVQSWCEGAACTCAIE